jgi:ABC-type cobalamin/Fe3+-siderophores transport system ATPase subunit
MNKIFPKGSEWRKWDLQLHTPFTKLNDGYKVSSGDIWDKFCDEVEKSDVYGIGITDYFAIDNYFIFKDKFYKKYPSSSKVFFPNIELRLNESVNVSQEEVNLHLVFRPETKKSDMESFLSNLDSERTDPKGKKLSCSQFTSTDYVSATVTRESITQAFEKTFGKKAIRQDYFIVLAAVNNDGIRPKSGNKRKAIITDEIDKFCDGFIGGSQNVEHFLKSDRLEDKAQKMHKKPVISTSDAHSFDQMNSWLGKIDQNTQNSKEITWIKSDLTYEGLTQIFIEPPERVRIQVNKPDLKDLYKTIEKITFSGTRDFPTEIIFSGNLSSIIGSRSSGKSTLINYIAHAIDKSDTELKLPNGPAANKKWSDIKFTYSVEWSDGSKDGSGHVIFLPQNYLFNISGKPNEITEKIKPVLFRKSPTVSAQYTGAINSLDSSNKVIDLSVKKWFELNESKKTLQVDIKNVGDKKIIKNAKSEYQKKINEIKKNFSLTDKEVADYQKITSDIAQKESKVKVLATEQTNLITQYVNNGQAINISVELTFTPSLTKLPIEITNALEPLLTAKKSEVLKALGELITNHKKLLKNNIKTLSDEVETIKKDNKALIDKHKQNEGLTKLIDEYNKQDELLTLIKTKEEQVTQIEKQIKDEVNKVTDAIKEKTKTLDTLKSSLSSIDQKNASITFDVETDFNQSTLSKLSDNYNLKETKDNPYIENDLLLLPKIRKEAEIFLISLYSGAIRLKMYQDQKQVAAETLCFTEEIRFSAIMEEDKIGGFTPSSMTPGKQALFALTLILDESNDSWPLLIDQPEDDLDSRSIYNNIAAFLKNKKRERQIIMVSHNANLVIGSDSEQLIIANKHGDDRKNKNGQMFNYLSGSLENTNSRSKSEIILETCGIREHACDILDGGEEAFEKRKNMYRIKSQ